MKTFAAVLEQKSLEMKRKVDPELTRVYIGTLLLMPLGAKSPKSRREVHCLCAPGH